MSKITPGPWTVVRSENEVYVRDRGGLIAQGPKPSRYEGQDARYDAEVAQYEANARAISAVPEMMEALESVLIGGNHLGLVIGADHPPHTATHEDAQRHYGAGDKYEVWCCWQAIMNARADLAKARGETP